MALLFVFIAVQLLFLCSSTNAAENESCIHNYAELERALRDSDTNNSETILNAFYPPNSQNIQIAHIKYCISENKMTNCSTDEVFKFKWAASALLFIQEYELMNALVFGLFKFPYTNITLIISPPFCEDVSEENKKDYLQQLTTRIKHYAHSDHKNGLQDYAVYSNTTTNTIDIKQYHIAALQWSLLILQYVAIITIIITLLLRIISPNSFAYEIDIKLDKISKSFSLSRISSFIKGMKEDIDDSNQSNRSKASQKKSFEYTVSYFLLLVGFTVWDSVQYCQSRSEKLHSTNLKEWHLFFPIPYIAPIVFGVSLVISILGSGILLCCQSWNMHTTSPPPTSPHNTSSETASNSETASTTSGSETTSSSSLLNLANGGNIDDLDVPTQNTTTCCTCCIRDLLHFPILTGLGVFFVIHGTWMLLTLSTYAEIVIAKSLFILPLLCFVMALLPRLIKGFFYLCIDPHCQQECCKITENCMKCKNYDKCHNKCKKCKKCKTCTNCNNKTENPLNNHYNCKKCIKCDTCKERKQCDQSKKCDECKMCTCDQCQRCIHCKECTLCKDCKNCKKCTQCYSCNLSNCFKLCIDCMNERKERNCKNFTAIYGFIMIMVNAIPLLLVLYYGSNYILVVTDLNGNLVQLLIALAVIVGVPYYLILLWDSDNDDNDGKANRRFENQEQPLTNQPSTNNGENQPPTNQPHTNQPPPNDGEQQDASANVTPTSENSGIV